MMMVIVKVVYMLTDSLGFCEVYMLTDSLGFCEVYSMYNCLYRCLNDDGYCKGCVYVNR